MKNREGFSRYETVTLEQLFLLLRRHISTVSTTDTVLTCDEHVSQKTESNNRLPLLSSLEAQLVTLEL